MSELKILAIDPATRTGWAHSSGVSGVWDLSIRRDESSGMRLIRLQGKLQQVYDSIGIDLLVFEAARHGAAKMQGALSVQSEIQGVIKLWCERNAVDYRGYSPSEIKKHATGKGNASKQMVIDAAESKWAEVIDDADVADAKWLLDLAVGDIS